MSVIEQRLQGFTAAEFGKAERLFRWASRLQFAITAFAAAAVFAASNEANLVCAIISLLLYAAWVYVDWSYRESRGQAERGRRALWIADGLGDTLSPAERLDVEANFSVTAEEADASQNPDFFATGTSPGRERLAKLIEESGFYSCRLYRLSAKRAWTRFAAITGISIVLFISSVTVATTEELITGARVLCTLLVFLVGNELLGTAWAYTKAHGSLSSLQARLRTCAKGGFPEGDLLMILGDYNSAVESAPLMSPGIYRDNAPKLDELWRRHQERESIEDA